MSNPLLTRRTEINFIYPYFVFSSELRGLDGHPHIDYSPENHSATTSSKGWIWARHLLIHSPNRAPQRIELQLPRVSAAVRGAPASPVSWQSLPPSSTVSGTRMHLPWRCRPVSAALLLSPARAWIRRSVPPRLQTSRRLSSPRALSLRAEVQTQRGTHSVTAGESFIWPGFSLLLCVPKIKIKPSSLLISRLTGYMGKGIAIFFNFKLVKHIQILFRTSLCGTVQHWLVLSSPKQSLHSFPAKWRSFCLLVVRQHFPPHSSPLYFSPWLRV